MGYQQQSLTLEISGLYTSANSFTGVPKGALDQAENIVIDHKNIAESRRGFEYETGTFGTDSDRCNAITSYQSSRIIHYGTTGLAYYNSGWTNYSGSYTAPDAALGARVRFYQANKNLYIATSTGVKKLDVYNGTPVAAGVPKALDLQATLSGSSGFFDPNVQVSTTASTTNTSTSLSRINSVTGIEVGQYIYGTGIPSGTTVSAITQSSTAAVTTGNTTIGTTNIANIASNSGLAVGRFVVAVNSSGTTISQPYTRITAVNGAGPYNIDVDLALLSTETAAKLTVSTDNTITMSAAATATASGVAIDFSDGSQVAYRGLFGYRDANNNVLYGAPSQFTAITNTNGVTSDVAVTMTIPSGVTTSYFWQLYRSSQTADASITPTDDMQLVYEASVSSSDITNGYVTVTDSISDSLRGAFLYTGVGQEGIAQANYQPPFCKDFCAFKNFGLYANVKFKQRKKLTILAVGGSNGIALDDTLTIAGVTFTAKASETIASGQYKLFTSGTAAQNITDTTNSLIRVINRYASNTATYATLISGPTDLPGQILLEERSLSSSSFAITVSARGSAFSPTLPTSGTSVSSAQDTYKNGIVVSKDGQPEACPEVNLFFAGDANKEILRIIPLREYVLVLKQDGIYRITGNTVSTMSVAPFDLTTNLIAPNSVATLGNEVWGLFDQGVCAVSDTGVSLKSYPIDDIIRELVGTALSDLKTVSFGVGYETDRRYILGVPTASGDTTCEAQYTFSTITNAWTKWTRNATVGFVDPSNDNLYLGNGGSNTVSKERKSFTYTDFADESIAVTISSSSSYSVTLSSVSGVSVGDVLLQGSSFATITAISNNTLTVSSLISWSAGAASVYPSIDNVLEWKPIVADNPSYVRQYSEGQLLFKQLRFNTATISCYTDMSQSYSDTTLSGFTSGTWGSFAWGEEPWGGSFRPRGIRFLVPQGKQMGSQFSAKLTINNAYSDWQSEGIRLSYSPVSQETI